MVRMIVCGVSPAVGSVYCREHFRKVISSQIML